jgi:hypothetical protein
VTGGRASGRSSSFTESLIPLRALTLHAQVTGDERSQLAAECASEVFLAHRLFRRRHSGRVIAPAFLQLHYPCYWHYDILFGLEVLGEAGHLDDADCDEALELLRGKALPDGGFPAEHAITAVVRTPLASGLWWTGDPSAASA